MIGGNSPNQAYQGYAPQVSFTPFTQASYTQTPSYTQSQLNQIAGVSSQSGVPVPSSGITLNQANQAAGVTSPPVSSVPGAGAPLPTAPVSAPGTPTTTPIIDSAQQRLMDQYRWTADQYAANQKIAQRYGMSLPMAVQYGYVKAGR